MLQNEPLFILKSKLISTFGPFVWCLSEFPSAVVKFAVEGCMKIVEHLKIHHMEALLVYFTVSHTFFCGTNFQLQKQDNVDFQKTKFGLIW